MIREIKVRAWHTVNKTMLYGKDVSVLAKNLKDDSTWKYLLFTGLLDKNAKEIYDEDICLHDKTIGLITWKQEACAFWFKYFDGRFHRYKELKATPGSTYYQNDIIEIIGNIYENPELLK